MLQIKCDELNQRVDQICDDYDMNTRLAEERDEMSGTDSDWD